MHLCSYIVNVLYGLALLIIVSSDVEKNRYRDFWRMHYAPLSTRANPWAGKYAPDAQRYMVCLCVIYMAAFDYVIYYIAARDYVIIL